MTNKEIAKLLRHIAAVYTVLGENRFKIIAYENAAESIENHAVEVIDLWKDGKLNTVPGIGKGIGLYLDELCRTGKVLHFEEMKRRVPGGMFALLEVSGFGPKRAYLLAKTFRLESESDAVVQLQKEADLGRIAKLEGFGEKSQSEIGRALEAYKKGVNKKSRILLDLADTISGEIVEFIRIQFPHVQIDVLGSLRRRVATIGDIDIAVGSKETESVIDYFLSFPRISHVIEKGPTGTSVLLSSGIHVDLRVIEPEQYGSMLQYFTGSKEHNIALREYALKKGLSLNEYGIKNVSPSKKTHNKIQTYKKEEDFYEALGLAWIPPELRESRGELIVARQNDSPKLVELKDIKGDLHIHSNYNLEPSHDLGTDSVETLLTQAQKLGYDYIGISDHNPSLGKHTADEIIGILKKRKEHFDNILYSSNKSRVHLFSMLEVDITPDGNIALPSGALSYVDALIVSIHSSFDQDINTMTNRILKALSQPKVKILGHPTARLLEKREGIRANWDAIFDFCVQNDTALEINANPHRLDLSDQLVFEARKKGVHFTIDTDSHNVGSMQLMHYGIDVARRGWLAQKDILNTLGYNEFRKWLMKGGE